MGFWLTGKNRYDMTVESIVTDTSYENKSNKFFGNLISRYITAFKTKSSVFFNKTKGRNLKDTTGENHLGSPIL